MEVTGSTFRMDKDFDVEQLFATSFGIYIPHEKGRTIIFRSTPKEANFLRDLPIHKSQKELSLKEIRKHFPDVRPTDENVYFEIFVCPDDALTMEFCKHGGRLEVLTPASVREAVAEELRKAVELYR